MRVAHARMQAGKQASRQAGKQAGTCCKSRASVISATLGACRVAATCSVSGYITRVREVCNGWWMVTQAPAVG